MTNEKHWTTQRCHVCGNIEAVGSYCTQCLAKTDESNRWEKVDAISTNHRADDLPWNEPDERHDHE